MTVSFEDGTLATDGLDIYQAGTDWFIPLTAMVEALGIAITVSPMLGQADGFYLDESNLFSLDKNSCTATFAKEPHPFDCKQVVTFDDEIYVHAKLLEKWFSIQIKINSFTSAIIVGSDQKFPKQLRRDRDNKYDSVSSRENQAPTDYDETPLENKSVGDGSFDQQLTLGQQKTLLQEESYFRHDTIATIEVLGFETKGFMGGENDIISESSLSISKKDPHARLLGAFKARSIEMLDLTLPSLPLITSSIRAQGLLISNFPLTQPSSYSTRDFRGPLPSNWEVELYQNDILIGRRKASTASEYEFKEVTLYFGLNRFRIVFYGPQGQRKENIEVVNVGQQSTRPAESYYRFGSGVEVDKSNAVTSVAQYKHGFSSNLNAGVSFFQKSDPKTSTEKNYGLIDLSGSFSRFFGTLNFAGNSDSGSAVEATVQAPFDIFVFGASHASLDHFQSPLYNPSDNRYLTQINKVNGNLSLYSFLPVRLDAELLQNTYDDGTQTDQINQRTSWQIRNTYWFNSLSQYSQDEDRIMGQLLTIFPLERYELRTLSEYESHLNTFTPSLEYRVSDKYSYELEIMHDFNLHLTRYSGTFNRLFQHATLSAELTSDTQGNYRAIGIISYSGTHNPRRNDFKWSPRSQTSYGAASARVFLDNDYNGLFGEGDTPLKGVSLRVNQNDVNSETDENGEAIILGLPVHQDTDISLALKSLPDPFYRPSKKGFRLIPRPGQVCKLEFPITMQSEVDGMVQVEKTNGLRGLRNITVQLKDMDGTIVAFAKTESDGFYFIEGILPGDYILTLDFTQPELKDLEFIQITYPVHVTKTGLVESTFDFRASNKRSTQR